MPGGKTMELSREALLDVYRRMRTIRVFEDKLSRSYKNLKKDFGDKVQVPENRKFLGFDGYKKAMDVLRPGDRPSAQAR